MSSVEVNSVKSRAVSAASVLLDRTRSGALSWERTVALTMTAMMLVGFGLRVKELGRIGFAEDEINKVEAVRAYDRGDFTLNAEHPFLMKALMDVSLRGARLWQTLTGQSISEEAALRFPNALVGALTAIPLFLLTAALFDRRTALWAAALWSFGINAITYNRIGKEDSLMVFFMLFAFYFFIRAKQMDGRERKQVKRYRNLSAAGFGLMLASKYFPHYLGLNMMFHHFYSLRKREADEPRWTTPLSFFIIIGVVFIIANPAFLLPRVWEYLDAYSGEKLLTHSGYLMGDTLYRNVMSASPFWGLPVYFYFLFLAIKVPLVTLIAFLIGTAACVRGWRKPGPGFVLFMLFFWLVPYSLAGAKWLRYALSLMPFLYMAAAVGITIVIAWARRAFDRFKAGESTQLAATAAILILFLVLPAWTAYAAAPHYALYSNVIGQRYTAYFFPHDEFYDDGLSEAIRNVSERAPQGATIVSEAPGVVRYYIAKFGRTDLQSRALFDPQFSISNNGPSYFILQRGRTYFENQEKMKEVKTRFTLIYAGCINGHTATEVYANQPGPDLPANPCGDARP